MATYTLKSKAYTDSGYTGNNNHRYFKLTYTTTKTSTPGETRVDWQFISAYEGASAGLNIYCKCTLKTKVEKGTLVRGTLPSYTQTTWKAVRFNNGGDSAEGVSSINKTGTFYVKHADDGEAKLAAEITNCAIYTQGTSLNRAATFTLTDNFPITQITAPTFFSAEGEIISNRVVRGENIVLNWSGEKEGVANAIAGYKIYYTISKDGTKPSINSNVISIEGIVSTYTFPVDKNAIRGNKIVFAIQVIGASGKAAYNSELQFSEAVTINVIPSSPQVTFSKNKLPNKGGTFGISFESEWPVEYSTKTNPNQWLKIAPTSKFTYTTSGTLTEEEFYFRKNDGLEKSSSTTVKMKFNQIIKNVEVTFNEDDPTYFSSLLNPQDKNNTYYISRNMSVNVNNPDGDACKYTYYVYHAPLDSTKDSDYTKTKIVTTTTNSLSVADIRKYIGVSTKALQYYYAVEIDDGYDVVEKVLKEAGLYYLPPLLEFKESYNTNSNEFAKNANKTHFCDTLSFYFTKDTGYSAAQIEILDEKQNVIKTVNSALVHSEQRSSCVLIIMSSDLQRNKNYAFRISMTKGTIISSPVSIGDTYVRAPSPYPQNSQLSMTSFSPYSDTSAMWTINNYGSGDFEALQNSYDLHRDSFAFRWEVDGEVGEYKTIPIGEDYNPFSENQLSLPLSHDLLFSQLNSLGLSNTKTYTGTLRFQVTNAFGETEQVSHSCKITYDDQVPDLKSWVLYIANPANPIDTAEAWYKYDDLSNGRFLKEGTSLAYEVAIDDYYGIKNVEVLISTDGQATWKTCGSFSEFSGTDNDGAIYKTYKSEAKSACFIEYLGDLDVLNNTGYFKLKITNATGKTTTIESIQSFDYYAHNIPFISIKESKCTKENLTFTDIVDSGATTTESKNSVTKVERFYSLDDGKNFVPYNNPSDDRFGSIKVTHTEKITKEFVYVKLKVKTTQTLTLATNDIISTTREFVTDSIIVYNLVPTLAWRKNWIGINTEDYDSDNGKQSVLTVQGYDTRNRVLFKTGNATSYIELDPRGAGGAELINFIIDCGTWD